jgi:hypothetical protein
MRSCIDFERGFLKNASQWCVYSTIIVAKNRLARRSQADKFIVSLQSWGRVAVFARCPNRS